MSYLESLSPERRAHLLALSASAGRPYPAPAARPPPTGAANAKSNPAAKPPLSPASAARLQVRARALQEENASLRRNLQLLMAQTKRLDGELQTLRSTAQQREQRTSTKQALVVAELEEQQLRQRQALLDLAQAAEGLARENAGLHSHLAALQDENMDSSQARRGMQERLAALQSVCLKLEEQQAGSHNGSSHGRHTGQGPACPPGAAAAAADSGSGQQAALLEQLSVTLRALGPSNGAAGVSTGKLPPPVAPAMVEAAAKGLPTDMRLALRQLEAARRERDGLAARLKAAETQVARLQGERHGLQQCLARERHSMAASAAELQRRLKAAQDRNEALVKRCKEKDAAVEERDSYVSRLEQRLLQRRQPGASSGGSGNGNGGNGAVNGGGGSAAQGAAGAAAAGRPGRPSMPHGCRVGLATGPQRPGRQHGQAGVPGALMQPQMGSPGGQSLAALSPNPCSPVPVWQQSEQQVEQPADAGQGWPSGKDWMAAADGVPVVAASPGADSAIPAQLPRQELPPRRLDWPPLTLPRHQQEVGQETRHQQQAAGGSCCLPAVERGCEYSPPQDGAALPEHANDAYCSYQLDSPSPAFRDHPSTMGGTILRPQPVSQTASDTSGATVPGSWRSGGQQQYHQNHHHHHGPGGGISGKPNPLFSFRMQPAYHEQAGWDAAPTGQSVAASPSGSPTGGSSAGGGIAARCAFYHQNALFCDNVEAAIPQPAARKLRWAQGCVPASPARSRSPVAEAGTGGAAAHADAVQQPCQPPGPPLPSHMPSGEFTSVQHLLDALTPGSQPSDTTPGVRATPPMRPAPPTTACGRYGGDPYAGACGGGGVEGLDPQAGRPHSATTEAAMERHLHDAVACFFSGHTPAQQCHAGSSAGAAAVAGASIGAQQWRVRQQHSSPTPPPGSSSCCNSRSLLALKNGRLNRAADQQRRLQQGTPVRW